MIIQIFNKNGEGEGFKKTKQFIIFSPFFGKSSILQNKICSSGTFSMGRVGMII